MACSLNFVDAVEELNNYSDPMVREELEFLIGSNEGKSKLMISVFGKIIKLNILSEKKLQKLNVTFGISFVRM